MASRSTRPRGAFAVGLVVVLWGSLESGRARADESPATEPQPRDRLDAPVFVAYDLPQGCPPVGDFERDVQQRAPRARFTADPGARQFRATAWLEAEVWVGELTAIPTVDASSVRRVRGASCAEVASALALIVALALDPEAMRDPGGAGMGAPEQSAQQPPPLLPPPVMVPPPQPAPLPPESAAERSAELQSRNRNRWRMSAGADALAYLGVAPEALFGMGISVDVTPARDRVLTWLVRLSGAYLFPRDLGSPLKARFKSQFLAIEGCPVRLPLGALVSVLPCVGFEGGQIEVSGIDQAGVISTEDQSSPSFALMEALRVAVRLGKVLSLEAGGTLKQPFRHDSFGYSRPPVTVYTVPSVTGSFGLGLRVNIDFL